MKPETVKAALKHLRASDPVMNSMISDVGSYSLRLERNRFAMLVKSIISQQLSTAAARTIRTRLEEISAPERITPEMICQFDVDDLRAVGVSKQKATYILDLASQVRNGTVSLNDIVTAGILS